jgi:hypothetical protein
MANSKQLNPPEETLEELLDKVPNARKELIQQSPRSVSGNGHGLMAFSIQSGFSTHLRFRATFGTVVRGRQMRSRI